MIANIEADSVSDAFAKFAIRLFEKAEIVNIDGPGLGENECRETMLKEYENMIDYVKMMEALRGMVSRKPGNSKN